MPEDKPESPPQASAIPKALREAADEFHMWMGMCIALWAGVEAKVFRVCWKALGCAEEKAAIVYFRSPSMETRLTLTQELIESILPKTQSGKPVHPDLEVWKDIIGKFDSLKHTRNRIAHHPVEPKTAVSVPTEFPSGTATLGDLTVDYWYENYMSPEERLRGRHAKDQPLNITDLKNHYTATLILTLKMDAFLQYTLPTYL